MAGPRPDVAGCTVMTENVEAEGRTVNEATEKALEQLGLRKDQVSIEVLSEGRPRLLGFRGEPARVRVTALPPPPPPVERPAPTPAAVSEPEDDLDEEDYEDEEDDDETEGDEDGADDLEGE